MSPPSDPDDRPDAGIAGEPGLPEDRPFSPASERNREPILAVLRQYFAGRQRVLEIGSGTGQHAVHFAAALPHLHWQASDRADNLPGIGQWLAAAALPNTPAPIELDVDDPWPHLRFDAVFTANTLHIMGWPQVQRLFAALPGVLVEDAVVVVYGPFHRDGRATSDSNARFDAMLRSQGVGMGVRDLADVQALARAAGLAPVAEQAMPANNLCLVWRYAGAVTGTGGTPAGAD